MLIRTAAAAAVVLALAGCADAGRDVAADASTRAGASLADTCAQVTATIRDGDVVTLRRHADPAHEAVLRLSRDGDPQSRAALAGLASGLRRIDSAQHPQQRADARAAWSRALHRLDATCRAAGAPAAD